MIFTFIRLLFLLVHFLLVYQGTSRVGPDPNRRSSPLEYPSALSHTGVATVPGETAVHDLAPGDVTVLNLDLDLAVGITQLGSRPASNSGKTGFT